MTKRNGASAPFRFAFERQMKKLLLAFLSVAVLSGGAPGAARGGLGLLAEYDSNVFGDYWGGGGLNGTAYLDLGFDQDLGLGGLALGADYKGDFSTYLQYRDISQSDHDLRLLLWKSAGREGFVAAGPGLEYGINGQGRSYYDNRFVYGAAEGKAYLMPALMLRLAAAYGSQAYPNLPEYDCNRFNGEVSLAAFLPTRTSLTLGGNARWYGYSPGGDSLRVPGSIAHLEPGIRVTQQLASGLGLAVEYFGVINRVFTTQPEYRPDTLLAQVFDYSDHRGGIAGIRLTAKAAGFTAVARSGYQLRSYTSLEAFSLPQTDTASLAARQTSGSLRRDRVSTLGLEVKFPISPQVRAKAGLEYVDHGSNDALFDYYRTMVSAGLEYAF